MNLKLLIMKKLLFILVSLVILSSSPTHAKSYYTINRVQQIAYDAYIFHGGNWHTGKIYIIHNQNGYQLMTYDFKDISFMYGQPLSGNFYQGQQLTRLNPNSDLAKNNNFTHYVDIQGVKAYIIAN